jgi:2-methylcitrate dehydratase PrpD
VKRAPGPTLAATLGAFAADTRVGELPALALERAAMSLASTLASASAGFDIPSARMVRELEQSAGPTTGASVWFAGSAVPVDRAARVNAMASDAAASDDSDLRSIAHIGTIASATGLALGERLQRPGREVLAAMVLGYEVAGRVDEALTPGRMQRGFHGSVSTIFCGAVTAGRLLRLDGGRMAQAIALAASSACGMAIAADTSCAREYHAGLAALLGVQAALAAQAGFEAEPAVLEAPRGFFAAFNGQAVEEVASGLGSSWDIVTDMAIKLMPGAHPIHAIAEAATQAALEGEVQPGQVRRIVVTAPQLKIWEAQSVQPHDLVGAAHSVAYFVAASVVDRRFDWDHFRPEKMRDPAIAALVPRVVFDPEPPPLPDRFAHRHGGSVAIELDDGRVLRATCTAPRGSGPRGIAWSEVDAKYRRLAPSAGLASAQVEHSLELLHRFESLASPAALVATLSCARVCRAREPGIR